MASGIPRASRTRVLAVPSAGLAGPDPGELRAPRAIDRPRRATPRPAAISPARVRDAAGDRPGHVAHRAGRTRRQRGARAGLPADTGAASRLQAQRACDCARRLGGRELLSVASLRRSARAAGRPLLQRHPASYPRPRYPWLPALAGSARPSPFPGWAPCEADRPASHRRSQSRERPHASPRRGSQGSPRTIASPRGPGRSSHFQRPRSAGARRQRRRR